MNALDILKYGHGTLLQSIDGLPDDAWDTPGACGDLSARALLIHMTAQEAVLGDVLSTFAQPGSPTPHLDRFRALQGGDEFTLEQIAAAQGGSAAAARAGYQAAHDRLMALAAQIPPEQLREVGTIPWYGPEYALDDLIVYFNYGHKREHSGQLGLFRDRVRPA
ncbi:MAG TPA: maleylpyruvate isomerase N-terminal domain-containing protein [Chloroflexia bacterium]|nr:maleylpyruvate isomerase N-terminal domain-containing protein [Chloroflexia bacterium]